MTALVVALLCIPAIDHAVKVLFRRRLGARTVSLGALGTLHPVPHRLWLTRAAGEASVLTMSTLWVLAATPLVVLSVAMPSCGPYAGLLLGGSLSNGLESAVRGSVTDYVCLRFWPAFNLADVALTAGAVGLVLRILEPLK